ncbi:MAG TPA: ABC transporter permease [Blastocatellia bacterium]|nr:ABC transporter permease [Blastocatellia bacterium]
MDTLIQDIKLGLRMLVRSPGFSLLAGSILAVGIGANTAVFSVVNGVLLRPLGFRDPGRLVGIYAKNPAKGLTQEGLSMADFVDYRNQSEDLSQLAGLRYSRFTLLSGGEPEIIMGALVSSNFFPMLGVNLEKGRSFAPEEDNPRSRRVAILSHGLWQRRFGLDPNIIEQPLRINGEIYTVVGVLPREFQFPKPSELAPDVEIWANLTPPPLEWGNRSMHFLAGVARLNTGISLPQAGAQLETVASRLEQQYPDTNKGWSVDVVSIEDQIVGNAKTILLLLLGAVSLVLLIACANVAGLQVARGAARQKEIAIRAALGAGRSTIVRQLLIESIALAVASGAVGLVMAEAGSKLILKFAPISIPRANEIGLDFRVLAFALMVSIATGVIFGLLPAFHAAKVDVNQTLKQASRGQSAGGSRVRARNLLVGTQIALSVVLMIAGALLVRSFKQVLDVAPGFVSKDVWTMEIPLPWSRYRQPKQQVGFFQELFARVAAAQTEIGQAGGTSDLPLSGGDDAISFVIEGQETQPYDRPLATWTIISAGYFSAMGVPLLEGRSFSNLDGPDSPRVAIINSTMARRYWPGEDPVGRHVRLKESGPGSDPISIVGIVGDVRHWGLESSVKPEAYLPFQQEPVSRMFMVVRSAPSVDLAREIRGIVSGIDADQPVANIKTMDQVIAASVARRRFSMLILSFFAVLAFVLSVIGVHGVVTYSVSQRFQEMGIRLALGAQRADLMRLVLLHGFILLAASALAGFGTALVAAWGFAAKIDGLLFDVRAFDPLTFAIIPVLLIATGLLATYLPARRAARLDPVKALRYD